jgi:hypothetical protein
VDDAVQDRVRKRGLANDLSTGAEVSPNYGRRIFPSRRVWGRSVISRLPDLWFSFLVGGRGVLAPAAG